MLLLLGGGAAAAPARPAPKAPPPPVWIGVFTPRPQGGSVRVLTPSDGPAATGDVLVLHPLLGKTWPGKVDKGQVALADFATDPREGDDGVVVVPAGTPVAYVALSKPDDAAIRAALMKGEALAHVKKALADLQTAGVDLDGDGKIDLVMTYGCTAWFDGSCQSRGQFVLERTGNRWAIVE